MGKKISIILNEELNENIIYTFRTNPDWKYYRSINSDISIFESKLLVNNIKSPIKSKIDEIETLNSDNGTMYSDNSICNFISNTIKNEIIDFIKLYKKKITRSELYILPLENIIIAIYDNLFIIKENQCGLHSFKLERNKILNKQKAINSFLHKDVGLRWCSNIDGEEFEIFVLDLLLLQNGVSWARKVSPSNERDGGRDIICEWYLPELRREEVSEKSPPKLVKKKILVQVKAYSKPVGKSKVTDIRDIIEHYDADGYLLVTSNLITSTLTEHLERIKDKNKIFIDWWTNIEIEKLLTDNPEIIDKYPNIINYES